jgi:hypothetical protein
MIWPPAENTTVTILDGTLALPARATTDDDALLPLLPRPENAAPEPITELGEGRVRIDRLGLELSTESNFKASIEEHDPLSAVVEMRQSQTVARGAWQIRVETETRMSCNRDAFVLRAAMRAFEANVEICSRSWDQSIPRMLT